MKLLITMPLYDGRVHHACMAGVMQVLASYGADNLLMAARQGSFLPRLRDLLTKDFLDSKAEFMLGVDSDVGFTMPDVSRLWGTLQECTLDREMVSGLYPKKSLRDPRPIVGLNGEERGVLRGASFVGAGFFMVHRSAIERMTKHYEHLSYPVDAVNPASGTAVGLWSAFGAVKDTKGNARYLGEDYSFCERFRQMGGKIWVHPEVRLAHVGECTYTMGDG